MTGSQAPCQEGRSTGGQAHSGQATKEQHFPSQAVLVHSLRAVIKASAGLIRDAPQLGALCVVVVPAGQPGIRGMVMNDWLTESPVLGVRRC
jgi:hypothetical protein